MSAVALEDVKAYLNIAGSDQDAEVAAMLAAAEAQIAQRIGPLEPTEVTSRVRGGTPLILPYVPVGDVTVFTASDGSEATIGNLDIDQASGIAYTLDGTVFCAPYYTITYTAGYESLPADLVLAVKELVRHLWTTQRGPTRRPGSPQGDSLANTLPGSAFSLPIRVEQLLRPYSVPKVS